MAPSLPADAFEQELVGLIPHMRAFARSLCKDPVEADDLVQEALAKALQARDGYKMGTNMKAWTFMILRNHFYSEKRRTWRWCELQPSTAEATLVSVAQTDGALELDDVRQAMAALPDGQREALILVGAGGLSYEEAAQIMDVAIGTVKSRVSRARYDLERILQTGVYPRDGRAPARAMDIILAAVPHLAA